MEVPVLYQAQSWHDPTSLTWSSAISCMSLGTQISDVSMARARHRRIRFHAKSEVTGVGKALLRAGAIGSDTRWPVFVY